MGAQLNVCPDDDDDALCEGNSGQSSNPTYEALNNKPEPCPGAGTVDGHELHLLGKHRDFDEFFFSSSFDGSSSSRADIAGTAPAPSGLARGSSSSRSPAIAGGRGAIAREIMDILMSDARFPIEEESDALESSRVVLPFGSSSSFGSASNRGASFASFSSFGSFASAMSAGRPLSTAMHQPPQPSKQQYAKKSILQLVSSLIKGMFIIMHSDDHGLTECTMQLDKGFSVLEFRKQGALLLNVPLASVEEAVHRSGRTVRLKHGVNNTSFIVELDDENQCIVFVACVRVCAAHHRRTMQK